MGARWKGNVGKLGSIEGKRTGNRWSIKPPKGTELTPYEECRERGEFKEYSPSPLQGRPKLYTPEQEYNYKSQWARYQKALWMRPSKVEQDGKKTIYYYKSCNSPSGYWHVTLGGGEATYLELGRSLTIVCPVPYQFTGGDSDGEEFVWEQVAGNRTVVVDPPTALNPVIRLQNTCYTTGCDSGTSLPIILRVYPVGQPELFDDLVIYNTPTSTHAGNAHAGGAKAKNPCTLATGPIPAPLYSDHAYATDNLGLTLTWNLPSCDTEQVVATAIEVNTTGAYLEVEDFPRDSERFFGAEFGKYYRIRTDFRYLSKTTSTYSAPFTYQNFDNNNIVFGDDTQRGLAFKGGRSITSKVELKVTAKTFGDTYTSGISFAQGRSGGSKVELIVTSKIIPDTYTSGISFAPGRSRTEKVQLGGIVIG